MAFLLQLVYSYVFTPALEYYLIRKSRDNTFVLMCSDAQDFAAVFKGEPNPQTVAILRYAMEAARERFSFIGGFEIFTSAEWRRRVLLERQHPVLFSLFQDFLKCRQSLAAVQEAPSAGERRKAAAALMKIAGCNGEPFMWPVVQEALASRLEELLLPFTEGVDVTPPVQFFSPFLGWTFSSQPVLGRDLVIVIPAKIAMVLAAILPDGRESLAAFADKVEELRHRPDVEPLFIALWENHSA